MGKSPRENHHLRERCQQRGVLKHELHMLLDTADRLVPVGGGCVSMTLSRSTVAALRAEGVAAADLERARRRAVVIDVDGDPITVVIPSGRHGRCYRRGVAGRRRSRR